MGINHRAAVDALPLMRKHAIIFELDACRRFYTDEADNPQQHLLYSLGS